MQIIDCHVHPQPAADYEAAASKLLEHMRMHGIEQMILSDLGDVWCAFPDSGSLRKANDRLQKVCADSNNAMHYLVYLNPQLDDWQEEFFRHAATAVGVKLWISLYKENADDLSRSIKVLQTAAQHDLPVLIHTFEKTDPLSAGTVGIDGIIKLAQAVPECRIVAAHACGSWRRAIKRAGEFPENIVFDVSGSYPERTMVKRLYEAFGAKRLLYGSDAYGRSFGSQKHKVFEAKLSEEDNHAILYANACRIFKLQPLQGSAKIDLPRRVMADLSEDHFCFAGISPWFDHRVTAVCLAENAEKCGVKQAFAASLEAACSAEFASVNIRWLNECSAYKVIKPLAAVDLRDLPQAFHQLKCMAGFAGLWISPYLHGYDISDAVFRAFFEQCSIDKVPIWINMALSDDRFRCRDLKTRECQLSELTAFAQDAPQNHCVVQGAVPHGQVLEQLPENFALEYSRLSDGEYLAENFQGDIARLRRGSEYPFRSYDAVDNVLLGIL